MYAVDILAERRRSAKGAVSKGGSPTTATLSFGEHVMRCFIFGRTRKGYAPRTGEITMSTIFDWWTSDFKKGCNSLRGDAGGLTVHEPPRLGQPTRRVQYWL